jgi:hypothetical protein
MHAAVALAGVDLIGRPMGVKSRPESGLTNESSSFVSSRVRTIAYCSAAAGY